MEEKISVIIPAYNEEKNIEKVIDLLKKETLIDEIIVIDNASDDNTSSKALSKGVNVYNCPKKGKGYAMEEGISRAKNPILVFLDADINNYSKKLVEKLTKPILLNNAGFVKASFERNGGRVTNLVVKPMLDILYPNIYKFSQPLSGMIAGRKEEFEKIELEKDYGVDIGILLDMIKNNVKIEEVHIGKINNDSQPWKNLEDMSRQVIRAILKRANLKIEE